MATQPSRPQFEVHELTSEQQSPETFKRVLDLSRSVFDPGVPEDDLPPPNQLSNWRSKIQDPHASIFYITGSNDPRSQPFGFVFVHARTHPEIGRELLHILFAAVSPASRGKGMFPLLVERSKEYARGCGYEEITICTYPARFKKMFRVLCENGWVSVAWIDGEKVLMKTGV